MNRILHTIFHIPHSIWKWVNATRLRKLLSLTLAILILLTSIKYIFLYPKEAKASSLVYDGTSTNGTRYPGRRIVRTTNGPSGHRVFVALYDGSTNRLLYSDDSEAASPTWTSVGTFGGTLGVVDMVWDETNNVLYIVNGRDSPNDNNASDITYRRVTDLGGTPTLGTDRVALNATAGATIYSMAQVEIAQDSGTTKVFVFGNRSVAAAAPSGWDVAVGTINSDNPTWGTLNVKTYAASTNATLMGVTRSNTNKLIVQYYDGTNILATRHDDADDAEATSGWDALDGTNNSTTTISSDDPVQVGPGSIVGLPSSDAVWFSWYINTGSTNFSAKYWSGTALAAAQTIDTSDNAYRIPSITTDGVTLWVVYSGTGGTLVFQSRSATDGNAAWSGTTTTLDVNSENIGYPNVAKKIYQNRLDVVYTTQTSAFVQHVSYTVSADALFAFDEGYGTTTNDRVGNVAAGTITNAIWKTPEYCVRENCLYYDGSGDKVAFADDNDLDVATSSALTVTGWFRTPDITSGTRTIIAKHNATNGGYKVYMDSNGYVIFGIDDDPTFTPDDSVSTTTTAFDDNNWHNFAAVKDATSITLYVDGHQYQTDSSLAATGALSNADSFYVGIDGDGSSNGFSGFIDEVKLYKSARTSGEVKADYNGETPSRGVSAYFGPDQKYLSNGLVGYWLMEEASDATRLDSSGNGNTLTESASDTVVQAPGKFGYGGDFELGDTEYISSADSVSLSITGSLTLSAWIKPETVSAGTYNIISKWDGSNESYRLMQNGDEVRIEIDAGGQYVETTASNLAAGTWYHIVGTYDSSSRTAKVFVNGTEAASTVTGTIPSSIGDDAGVFHIGAEDSTGGATGYYDGIIDEARVYSRTFSPAEVGQLYNWAPGPIGYWKLDDNTGTSAFDSSGNGGTGTLSSAATWNIGKYGQAVDFDGSNSNIDISDADRYTIPTGGQFTVEAWINLNTVSVQQAIVVKQASAPNREWTLKVNSDGTPRAIVVNTIDGTYLGDSTAPALVAKTWYHLAFTVDATTPSLKFYVNGVQTGEDTTTTGTIAANGSSSVRIGRESGGVNNADGIIDDVRIYNYARTPGQVIEDMNGGHPAPGSPVGSAVAQWKFDEGNSTTAHDNSVNANDLTLSTASWTNDGKFGKAWNGDGTIWMSRANDADFDFGATEDFTLSGWFKSDSATNPANGTEYILATTTGNADKGYAVYAKTTGVICFGIDDDTTWGPDVESCTPSDYYDGLWHHFTAVRNVTSDTTKIYIDAGEKDSDTDPTTATLDGDNIFYIGDFDGDNNATAGTEEFAGDIDEVKVFRSALSPDAIKVLYNQSSQAALGSLSTDSTGAASNSDTNSFCPPGQGSTCTAPVAYLKLDEGAANSCSGGTNDACDSSGNANDGAWNGDTKNVVGKVGNGASFDGTGDYIQAADSATLDVTSYTLEAWINMESITTTRTVVERGTTGSNPANFYLDYEGASTRWVYGFRNSGNTAFKDHLYTFTPTLYTWYHMTVTFDDTANTISLYIDGALVDSESETDSANTSGTQITVIGATRDFANRFIGKIDDFRLYNYVRTKAQIAWDVNRGRPVYWWKFDECIGTVLNDSSGINAAGTLTIGATGTQTSAGSCNSGFATEAWNNGKTGRFNSSLDFDATDDYASGTLTSTYNAGITVSAWVNFPSTSASELQVIEFLDAAAGGGQEIGISYGLNSKFLIWSRDGSDSGTAQPTDTPAINTWYHLVAVVDGTNATLYVNGVSAATKVTGKNPQALKYVVVGRHATSNNRFFNGQIDDVRIYNYALTTQQIKTVMNQGAAVSY